MAGDGAPFEIRLRDVRVDYPVRRGHRLLALDGVDLDVPAATFSAIIGPSGCGKSTVLRLLGGLLQPTSGSVTIGGRAPQAVAAEHRLGVAFQVCLSAPVSLVGAIIGEWFAAERGLGPLLVNAMQNYQIDLLWSAALIGAAISAVAYFALGALGRFAARRYRER